MEYGPSCECHCGTFFPLLLLSSLPAYPLSESFLFCHTIQITSVKSPWFSSEVQTESF